MTLSKPLKIIIGILTLFVMLFPFLIPVFMFLWVFSFSLPLADLPANPETLEFSKIMLPMLLYFAAMLGYAFTQLGLQIFYIIHAIKNQVASETSRILFVLGAFFLPFVAMPVYFVLYLWKDAPAETGAYPGKLPDQPAV